MPKIARVYDYIEHDGDIVGYIITGSSTTKLDDLPLARVGDLVTCTRHQIQTIITGSATSFDDSRPIARVGDLCSCGARIRTGSATQDAQ